MERLGKCIILHQPPRIATCLETEMLGGTLDRYDTLSPHALDVTQTDAGRRVRDAISNRVDE